MNRRHFLQTAGAAVAALGIDPELLIWRPRQLVVVPALPTRPMETWAHGAHQITASPGVLRWLRAQGTIDDAWARVAHYTIDGGTVRRHRE